MQWCNLSQFFVPHFNCAVTSQAHVSEVLGTLVRILHNEPTNPTLLNFDP